MIINYKGYTIDDGVTYNNYVSVQLNNGDDLIFKSVEEAKKALDEIIANNWD